MITLADYNRLKESTDALQRQLDEARGAAKQLRAGLRAEFGVGSVKEAKRLLARLRAEAGAKERAADEAKAAWDERWQKNLEGA